MKRITSITLCGKQTSAPTTPARDTFIDAITFDKDTSITTVTRNDGMKWELDFSPLKDASGSTTTITTEVVSQYVINNQDNNYTLTQDDYNGYTIVRGTHNGDQTITLPKPSSEQSIGVAVTIIKAGGEAGTLLYLKAGEDVTLLPADASPLRRVGNAVTLVYLGDGVFQAVGELP